MDSDWDDRELFVVEPQRMEVPLSDSPYSTSLRHGLSRFCLSQVHLLCISCIKLTVTKTPAPTRTTRHQVSNQRLSSHHPPRFARTRNVLDSISPKRSE